MSLTPVGLQDTKAVCRMNRLWGWIAAAGAGLLAVLLQVMGQKEKEKQARLKAERYQKEREMSSRQAQVRKETNEQKEEADARPDTERPSGSFRRK